MLEGGDEGKLDPLALLVVSLGTGNLGVETELLVGEWLDPDRLDQRFARSLMRIRRGL